MLELSETLNVYIDPEQGKSFHRVTSIIAFCFPSEYGDVAESTLENAADRGHAVEALCVDYLLNGYVDTDAREDCQPRIEAFVRWTKKHDVQYLGHQQTVFKDDIAGTLDFYLSVDGLLTIVDLKCCANKMKTWPIQVGAYLSLKRADQGGALQLHPDLNKSGFRWYPYKPETVMDYWNTCYQWWRLNQTL